MRWRGRGVLVVCMMVTMGFVTPASAKAGSPPNGVHLDPGSPAGKEYAIPLAAARGGAIGTSGQQGFGSGIARSAAASSPSRGRLPGSSSSRVGLHDSSRPGVRLRRSSRRSRSQSPGTAARMVATQTRQLEPAAGRILGPAQSSALVSMLAAGAVVLLAATLAGVRLTQRDRRTRPGAEY
jgi:hypothetical protein